MGKSETHELENKILEAASDCKEDNSFVLTAMFMASIRFASHAMNMPPYMLVEFLCRTMGKVLNINPPENLLEFVAEGMKAEREAETMRKARGN
jgi:hypothetical protein